MVARATLPGVNVGAATGAGHGNELFAAWPPQGGAWQMTPADPRASRHRPSATAVSGLNSTCQKIEEREQK